jgi:hypothetical protein
MKPYKYIKEFQFSSHAYKFSFDIRDVSVQSVQFESPFTFATQYPHPKFFFTCTCLKRRLKSYVVLCFINGSYKRKNFPSNFEIEIVDQLKTLPILRMSSSGHYALILKVLTLKVPLVQHSYTVHSSLSAKFLWLKNSRAQSSYSAPFNISTGSKIPTPRLGLVRLGSG